MPYREPGFAISVWFDTSREREEQDSVKEERDLPGTKVPPIPGCHIGCDFGGLNRSDLLLPRPASASASPFGCDIGGLNRLFLSKHVSTSLLGCERLS